MKLDKFDREILRVMQRDATVSMAELSQYVGLSHTPCWRRVKRMEADGIIRQKVTLLDAKKLNLGVSVFIYVTLKNHDGDSLTRFESHCAKYRGI
jgi:Lrp/AsnC family transcriptional regulator